jgi:radical SAM superfamily enzyme YgiQ (UPF0313 family)
MGSMRTLLVQAGTPTTYWSYDHSLPFIRKAAALPPLGLVSLAALLPASWEISILDLNVEPLRDERLLWADVVMVSGMLVQVESIREVLRRARALGRRTVLGGPAATTSPEAFPEADHLFRGEAEGRLALLVTALENPEVLAPRTLSPSGGERPAMNLAPVPRFDLIDLSRYSSASIQVSRGCPFDCEFCDIVEVFGRVPRLKSPDQVLAELDALHTLGWRGSLFVVDDNFIGNRREVARLLPLVAQWQERHGRPFDLYTEASVDLATQPDLVASMIDAGFTAVFLGIETPSSAALTETGKKQNLRMDPGRAVAELTAAGLEVFAGFIVGFDSDTPEIFDRQLEFIGKMAIPRAMVGVLSALPGTALWRRLEREGRLNKRAVGDQFDRPNFLPVMGEETLLRGYRRLLSELYSAKAYYHRCALFLEQAVFHTGPHRKGGLGAFWRAIWRIGVKGSRRWHFWRLVQKGLARGSSGLTAAVTLAILGEHLIRYTEETVLPRLDRALAESEAERRPTANAQRRGESRVARVSA